MGLYWVLGAIGVLGAWKWLQTRSTGAPATPAASSPSKPAPNPAVESLYGHIEWVPDPTNPDPQGIKITNGWAEQNIVQVQTALGPMPFNRRGAAQLAEFLSALKSAGLPVSVAQTWNTRRIRPKKPEKPGQITTGLSWHTYGAAVDLNPGELPFGKPAPDGHWIHRAAEIGKSLGWTWGGDFSYPDPMHFQLTSPRG